MRRETKVNVLCVVAMATIVCGASSVSRDEGDAVTVARMRKCKEPVTTVMEVAEGVDPEVIALRNNAMLIGKVGRLKNYYEFQIGCADDVEGGHPAAVEAAKSSRKRGALDPDVKWEMVQKKTLRTTKTLHSADDDGVSIDGYAPSQWHLVDDGNAATAHVMGAWSLGRFGRGVTVAVVDDGLDVAHPDIVRGCDRTRSVNYDSGGGKDPSPRRGESHGTGAGAVAAASGAAYPPGTPHCGHGVAPLANLVGIRLIAEPVSDADEAKALSHEMDDVAVYSCSWGPSDDGSTLEGPGPLAAMSIADAADGGRGGLGSVFAWAAGNGAGSQSGDSCAYDGYATDVHVVAVAALTHLGKAASYSERCPAVFISAPSSGDGRYVLTADVSGRSGSSTSDCNGSFGGTSAAAPFVAGVFALVFESDPTLRARDAMRIVAATARRIEPTDASWQRNAAGVWHSDKFGFGAIDAEAAVVAAEGWRREFVTLDGSAPRDAEILDVGIVGDCRKSAGGSVGFPCLIPDDGGSSYVYVNFRVDVDFVVERAVLTLSADHPRRGELFATLISPSGSASRFGSRPYDRGTVYDEWRFSSVAHWNERSVGTWTVTIGDASVGNRGTFGGATLSLYGREATVWDV